MNKNKNFDDHHCSTIEKKQLKLDMAYCNATYHSDDALMSCHTKAKEASVKRELACKYS